MDEARARLDVAELYLDMDQPQKAIRYLLEAAEILLGGGALADCQRVLEKVLSLSPDHSGAREMLDCLQRGEVPPAVPDFGPKPPFPPLGLPQPVPGKVLVPTPWLFRDPRLVAKARKTVPRWG